MKKVFFLLVIFLLSFNIVYSLSFEDANSNIFNNLKSSLNRFFGFETSSNIVRSVVIIDSRLYNLIKQDFDKYIQYAEDRRNFRIVIYSIEGVDDWNFQDIKSHILGLKQQYPDLEGILFVGNIKLPSFYKSRNDNLQVRLIPHLYEDLDIDIRKIYEPGTIDPLCTNENFPHCNVYGDHTVPDHDFDYMEKGSDPNPELWTAYWPVGFSDPSKNTYNQFAQQLRPFIQKLIKFYENRLIPEKKIYQVSNGLSYMEDIWNYYRPENIDFYSMNPDPDGTLSDGTDSIEYCLRGGRTAEDCYVRTLIENYGSFQEFWDYYQTREWMGEGWQVPGIYKNHMENNNYEFVCVNVHSYGEWSLISSFEARNLNNGGLVMFADGCSVAELFQPNSQSYVDSQTSPDNNILLSYLYGNSNFIAVLGDPFNRGHTSYFEKLIPFVNKGDYLGKAHLKRKIIQYENSDIPYNFKENTMEMLFGDPFLDFPEYPEISTTTTTTSSTTTTTLPTCQEACSGKLFSCTASVVNPDPTCVSSNSKCNYAKEQKFGTSCSGNCWCYLQDDCPNCGSNHVCTSLGCIPQAESNCEQNCNRADGCNSPDNFYYGGYYRDYYCSAQTNRCEFINLGCKKECVNLCSYYQQLDPERGYTCCDPNTTSSTSTSTTTTSTSTTTTIPTEFTLTNFDCNSVSEGCYECFIQYPTTSQKTVVFLVSDSNGKIWKSGLENINTGSTESKTTFCCDTLTGTHKISYWVYDDSYMSNLITWSTSNQKKDVECG